MRPEVMGRSGTREGGPGGGGGGVGDGGVGVGGVNGESEGGGRK